MAIPEESQIQEVQTSSDEPQDFLSIEDIPDIPALLDEQTSRRIKLFPHPRNRASEAGHPCERFLVLARTKNELRSLHDIGLQRIFDEGNLHEESMLREMDSAGFRIVEQQRPYEMHKVELAGRIDGKLTVRGHLDLQDFLIPFEIKSCSPHIFPAIKDMATRDMIKSKYPWIRKYPAQILLYMLMEGSEFGIMVFKNKGTGEKSYKIFQLDGAMLEYTESVLKKLESVNAHIKAGTEPPAAFIDDCKGCPFCKTACFPGQDYGPGIDILQDPDLEAKLSRRAELESASKEFESLDKEIKEGFRGRTAVIGDWMIESKGYEMTSYEIPKEIKVQYAVKKEAFKTKIERLA
jgi:hypothetical protein